MDISYPLYDTAVFSNAAITTHNLFQITEGADTTHTSDFTNMRGNGSLPSTEKYLLRWLCIAHESNLPEADIEDWFVNSYLRMYLSNQIIFQAPLLALIAHDAYSGFLAQAAAANRPLIGHLGDGYWFDPNVRIGGGVAFKVEVYQGTVLATASMRFKVILDGILSRPDAGQT